MTRAAGRGRGAVAGTRCGLREGKVPPLARLHCSSSPPLLHPRPTPCALSLSCRTPPSRRRARATRTRRDPSPAQHLVCCASAQPTAPFVTDPNVGRGRRPAPGAWGDVRLASPGRLLSTTPQGRPCIGARVSSPLLSQKPPLQPPLARHLGTARVLASVGGVAGTLVFASISHTVAPSLPLCIVLTAWRHMGRQRAPGGGAACALPAGRRVARGKACWRGQGVC